MKKNRESERKKIMEDQQNMKMKKEPWKRKTEDECSKFRNSSKCVFLKFE